MALNSDFKVKDSLYVGNSACFVSRTDTPRILSAGTDLWDIFLQEGELGSNCTLSQGTGIATFSYDGSADVTVAVDSTCNTAWNEAYTWCTTNGDNVIDTVAEGNAQGRIAVTDVGNTTTQVDVNGLQTGDSVQFAGMCLTGPFTTSSTVDGRDVACDGVTLDTLQSLSGDNGLTFSSPSQGTLRVTQADGDQTDIDLGVQTTDDVSFTGATAGNVTVGVTSDNTINTTSGNLTINSAGGTTNITDNTSVTGNISVTGTVDGRNVAEDGTTTDTLQSLSGDNVTGAGANVTQGCVVLSQADGTTVNADTGLTTSDSVQFAGLCTTGNITTSGTVDGRDVSNDGTTLDALQLLSGGNVTDVSASATQGRLVETSGDGTTDNIDLTDLGTTGTPTFGGITLGSLGGVVDNTILTINGSGVVGTDEADGRIFGTNLVDAGGAGTCNKYAVFTDSNTVTNGDITKTDLGIVIDGGLSATGVLSGDGSCLTNVEATPTFPTTAKTNLVSTDKVFVNDGASCQTACNKHITYANLLTDLAGTNMGLEVDSSDSLALKNYSNLTDRKVSKWDDTNGQFVDSSIIENNAGDQVHISGSLTVTDNLSVMGDFTCIDTTVSVTSALSVVNAGTGPAFYAEQTGVNQPIAQFVDTEGGQMVVGDTGDVGIGIIGQDPGEKLTVSGNISANGTLQIDGVATLGNASADVPVINGCGLEFGNGVPSGTDNTVLILNSSNCVSRDEIDGKVWAGALVDYGSSTTNTVPKFTDGSGTIGDSNVSDSGSLITLDSNTRIGSGDTFSTYASNGSNFTSEATFSETVHISGTTVSTFTKTNLKQVKYEITLVNGVNVTAFEVNAVYNGTSPSGTTYAIVDAQAATQLGDIEISSAGSTIDLDIESVSNNTTAVIKGTALY